MSKKTCGRCNDQMFLMAVHACKTFPELARMVGQTVSSTKTRYKKMKNTLQSKGVEIPTLQNQSDSANVDELVALSKKLQEIS